MVYLLLNINQPNANKYNGQMLQTDVTLIVDNVTAWRDVISK